mgnify:CR=1 FL=1
MENVRVLRKINIFKQLKGLDLVQINRIAKTKAFNSGDRIIEEGSPGECFYIIKSGGVRVMKKTKKGGEEVIAVLGPFDHFGEMSLFDKSPRSASIVASENCELIEIEGKELEKLMSHNPEMSERIYRNIISSLCIRLRAANEHMVRALGTGIDL